MRVGLVSWGTEGDVRPFFALASTLSARGHDVRVEYVNVEGRTFERLAEACGIHAEAFGGQYFIDNARALERRSSESLRHASPPKQFELILEDLMDPVADAILERSIALAKRSDVLVGHVLAHPVATAAEHVGVPFVSLALQPIFRSRAYPPAGAPAMGPSFHLLLWKLADWVMRRALGPRIAAQRARLSMPKAPPFDPSRFGHDQRCAVAVSPKLFPRPNDWNERISVTGFLALDAATQRWEVPSDIEAFLSAGPPVFASFGSMFSLSEELSRASVEAFVGAAKLADARVIVQCPAAFRPTTYDADRVLFIDRAPHSELFPRCAAVVHHGGAGTTQSALLAGQPSIVVPHAADQFYWADVLYERGAAAKPLRRKKLTARALAERIRWALDRPSLRARAAELGASLAREDGCTSTAEFIERAVES